MFEEELITAVSLQQVIYDKSMPDHKRKKKVAQAWNKIAEQTGKDGKTFVF